MVAAGIRIDYLAQVNVLAILSEKNLHLWSIAAEARALALSFKSEDHFFGILSTDIHIDSPALARYAKSIAVVRCLLAVENLFPISLTAIV